jgi:hypothetical protein
MKDNELKTSSHSEYNMNYKPCPGNWADNVDF